MSWLGVLRDADKTVQIFGYALLQISLTLKTLNPTTLNVLVESTT